ncbi:MAG: alpha-isopropylmalate synthase regulatory domain-containing protein [bacterium]
MLESQVSSDGCQLSFWEEGPDRARRILGDAWLGLAVVHYQAAEYLTPGGTCRVVLTLDSGGSQEIVDGQGVGFVDAAWRGLMNHFTRRFTSLDSLTLLGFGIRGELETRRKPPGLDAEVEVEVAVANREGRRFRFVARDRSTMAAALAAVVQLVERFVNTERAYVQVHHALADAEARHRPDLVDQYTAWLAELVKTNGFEVVAAQVRAR